MLLPRTTMMQETARAVAAQTAASAKVADSPHARALREGMVVSLIADGDLTDKRVAKAMCRVAPHAFVPDASLEDVYAFEPMVPAT